VTFLKGAYPHPSLFRNPKVVSQTIPWEDKPYGVVSLLEMLRVSAENYVAIGRALHRMSAEYGEQSGVLVVSKQGINDVARDSVIEQLGVIRTHCEQLELSVCTEFLGVYIENFTNRPVTRSDVTHCIFSFEIAFYAELSKCLFVFVYSERAYAFEQEMLFGEEVNKAFPSAKQEVRDAGTCFAFGLGTACVFHCMRVLEHGLRALAAVFGLPFGLEQWHNVIEQIESKIEALKSLPKSQQKVEEQEFYSKSATHFMFFKDAWRNHVMHGRRSYDEREARRVLDHTDDFMQHLAAKLHE
jgi:hypothetical protein